MLPKKQVQGLGCCVGRFQRKENACVRTSRHEAIADKIDIPVSRLPPGTAQLPILERQAFNIARNPEGRHALTTVGISLGKEARAMIKSSTNEDTFRPGGRATRFPKFAAASWHRFLCQNQPGEAGTFLART